MKMLHPLVLSLWLVMCGNALSLTAQELLLPDSMVTYQTMIKEAFSSEEAIPMGKGTPTTVLDFLAPVKATLKNPSEAEINYLTYGYLGYLKTLSDDYASALVAYDNGYRYLARAKPYDKYLGHYYFLRGKALLWNGDRERGLQSLADAEEVFKYKNDLPFLNRIYHSQSDFYNQLGLFKEALIPLDQSIKASKRDKAAKVPSLIKRGQLYSKLNEFEKADADFDLARTLLNKKNTAQSSALNTASGAHLLLQGKSAEALELYDEALEQLCPGIRSEKFQSFKNCTDPKAFLETLQLRGAMIQQSYHNNITTGSLKTGYNNYLTGVRYLQYLREADPGHLSDEEFKTQFSYFLENGIASCYLQDSLQQDTILFFQNALNFSKLSKDIESEYSIKVTDLQELADKEDSDFLSFFYGDKNLYAFVINQKGKQFYKISKKANFDKKLLELLSLQSKPFQSIKEIKAFKNASHQIYQQLFEELDLPNTKLCIIPGGLLTHLPFESLVITEGQAREFPVNYLLFHKDIRYAYSLEQLQRDLTTAPLDTRSVFTFAPIDFKKHGLVPLKGTPGHIRFLEVKFQCKKWINEAATTDNFQKVWLSDSYNMVVLETHAEAEQGPAIYFHDEKLPVTKLPKMSANIAILNNCNTAVTKIEQSKGSLYISNSFSESGIPATVAPLWSVQQRMTIKVLENFYLNLASGMEKDRAMKRAKISYLKECGNDAIACSPHFWAGIIITGNAQPLYKKSYLLPIVIFALIILLVFVWRRSQQEVG